MDKNALTHTTPGIDIENRIIDKYLPRIGVYGFGVYVVIKRYLDHTPTQCLPSYTTIARKIGMDQGSRDPPCQKTETPSPALTKPALQRR